MSADSLGDRYSLCLESSSDGVWDWDVTTDLVWYSERFRDSVGYTAKQWPGTLEAFQQHLHPDDGDTVWPVVEKLLTGGTDLDIQFRLLRRDGGYHWYRSRGILQRDGSGKPVRIAGAIHSIQLQKETEDTACRLADRLSTEITERRAAEALYFDLYDNSPDLYVSVDAQTALVSHCNQTVLDRLGRKREELIGKPIFLMYHPCCLDQVHATFKQFQETGVVVNEELVLADGEGKPIPVILNVSPIRGSNGDVIAGRSVWRDITEIVAARELLQGVNRALEARVRLRTQELERQNNDLNQFVHVASHDLKAPLRGIKMVATWLEEDCRDVLPDASSQHLEDLHNRVSRMEGLLDSILDCSKAGRSKFAPELVCVDDLIARILASIELPDGFSVNIPEPMPTLTTESPSLSRVFQNLIENAVKHRVSDSGNVTLTWRPHGDRIQFTVADDGPGIEPRFRRRVFEMFQTLRPRDEVEGSGIGLAIVKRLVESVGGEITVGASPANGAAFQFTWEDLQ